MPPEVSVQNRILPKHGPLKLFVQNPLTAGLILFIVGILLREQLDDSFPDFAVVLISSVATLTSLLLPRSSSSKSISTWSLCALIVFGAGWIHQLKQINTRALLARSVAPDNWQPVHLRGYVESIPQFRPEESPFIERPSDSEQSPPVQWNTTVDISVRQLITNNEPDSELRQSTGLIRVSIPGRNRSFRPGDYVECFLKWRQIQPPTNPGEYDFAKRLRHFGIFAQAYAESGSQIMPLDGNQWWRIDRHLGRFAMAGDRAIERYVSPSQAPLAAALVLGQRGQIEWDLQQSLLETGTIHLLAISGLHVEMVVLSIAIFCFAIRINLRMTLIVISIAVVMYAIICGAKPPVLRATLFVVLVAGAKFFGWSTRSYNILSFVALILLVFRTNYLWDTGTQLSFLAVATLILLAHAIRNDRKAPDPLDEILQSQEAPIQQAARAIGRSMREFISASAWVWLLTTPIVVSSFHVLAPVAILMNLVLLIPLWIGLLSGLGVVLLGTWLPLAGYLFGWLCSLALGFAKIAIETVAIVPILHWWSISPPDWWVICFYVLFIGMLIFWGFEKTARRPIFLCLLGWLVFGLIPWLQIFPQSPIIRMAWGVDTTTNDAEFAMTFINVGHGTSVVIQTPSRQCWLYDAGKMGSPSRAFYPIANVLWYFKQQKIDKLFLSHADADHFNAFEAIEKRFDIEQVVTTQRFLSSTDIAVQPVLKQLDFRRRDVLVVQAGDQVLDDQVKAIVLHPPRQTDGGSDNSVSLSLALEYNGYRFLLPGDLEGEGTRQLLNQPANRVDVLMAPHHGSLAESPEPLLGWCKPKHVVISGGVRAVNRRVIEAFSGNGSRDVWITSRENAIRFEVRSDGHLYALHWADGDWQTLQPDVLMQQANTK